MNISSTYDMVCDAFQNRSLQWNGTIVKDCSSRELALSPSGAAALSSICKGKQISGDNSMQSALVQLFSFYFFDQGSLSGVIDYASLLNHSAPIQPAKVSYEITKACNMSCLHCYNDSGKHDAAELYKYEKTAVVDYLGRWGVRYLHITGGEPIGDPSLPGLLSLAGQHGMSVIITTNGWTLPDALLTAIREGTVVQVNVSLDGADEATHDSFRRKKNSYSRAVNSIQLLAKCRPRILQLNFSVHAASLNQMKTMGNFALENGFDGISFKPVTFSGRYGVGQEFLLSLDDLHFFRKERVRLRALYKGRLHVEAPILDTSLAESVLDETECEAADRSMLVLSDGKMTPCASLKADICAPCIRDLLPIHAWLTHPLFVSYRSIKDELCRSNRGCPGERFTIHSGSGRELAIGACHE